jgi:hypothetical protein
LRHYKSKKKDPDCRRNRMYDPWGHFDPDSGFEISLRNL